MAVEWLSVPWS